MKKNTNSKAILIIFGLFLALIIVGGNTIIARASNVNYDDNYEENDAYTSAYDFSAYENTWLSTIDGSGVQLDDDWYEIYVDPGCIRLLVDCTFSGGNIELGLYDNTGTIIISLNCYGSSCSITYGEPYHERPPSGTYYIKVSGNNNGNEYDLKWDDGQVILLIILISIISGGAVISVVTILLIRRKRKKRQ